MAKTTKSRVIAKSKRKKQSRRTYQSPKWLIAYLSILVVAVLGVWTLLFSSATTPQGVRFVLLCPPAGYSCSGSTSTLASYASTIRSWYQGQLGGGRTFTLLSVSSAQTPYAPSYYYVGNTGSYQTTTDRLAAALGISNNSANPVKTVVMMGFHVFNHCGVTTENGAMAVGDPTYSCSNIEASVLAHELGHTFNLAYNGNYPGDPVHRTDGSLMNAPLACNGAALGSCWLNASDRAYLLSSQLAWFPAPVTASCSGASQLTAWQSLYGGQSIVSSNCYRLIFQSDGNLVIYNSAGSAIWNTGTNGRGGNRVTFQSDGNFVIYTSSNAAVWASSTYGHGGTRIVMQTDGNLVIYTSTNAALWSSRYGRTY